MGTAADIVSPRRDGIRKGEMGLYTPSFSVNGTSIWPQSSIIKEARPVDVENSERTENLAINAGALEKACYMRPIEVGTARPVEVRTEGTYAMASQEAGALGEARFEDVKSADGPINPSSVLEGTESADEPTNPPSVFVRSERNQLTEPLESTDGSMYPARVELMETSKQFLSLGETRPVVATELDAVEDSSRFISNHSEATITVVPVKHATTRAVVYSNSSPGDFIIIIEEGDDGEKCPVMDPDALQLGAQDATAATNVALGANDCCGRTEKCSMPAVAVEEVRYEKGEDRLSPGSTIVGGRKVHQSLIDSGPLRTLVSTEEGLMHGDPRQLRNEENMKNSKRTMKSPKLKIKGTVKSLKVKLEWTVKSPEVEV